MTSLGEKWEGPKASDEEHHPNLSLKASKFPHLHNMKNGEEAHVTVRLVKTGSRLLSDRSDTNMDFDMTHMGHEDNDDDFSETIGFRPHGNHKRDNHEY